MGGWRPDEIITHPDGSQEWIKYRKYPRQDGTTSLMIKIKAPDGTTKELWHVVRDLNGNEIHRDAKDIRRRGHDETS